MRAKSRQITEKITIFRSTNAKLTDSAAGSDKVLTDFAKKLSKKKNPVRGGYLTGFVGGGNEGKEETSFRLLHNYATTMPFDLSKYRFLSSAAKRRHVILLSSIYSKLKEDLKLSAIFSFSLFYA
jgi:hypothetical protein